MKIISWNVNGIRAVYKKDKWQQILDLKPDIFCLQETKANPDQMPEEVRNPAGYHSFFDHPKEKKGYSGVAIYSKVEPEKVQYEMGDPILDNEGRLVAAFFKDFVLLNVYFPNGGGGPERLKYKLDFYDKFILYIEELRKEQKNVIFCGDINTAHNEIDLARPKENEKNTGFLPIERAWLDKVVATGYVDSFRHFNPGLADAYTYWDMKTFARDRNVGWRIDYFFVTPEVLKRTKAVGILSDVFGSDHCPIFIDVDFDSKKK
jgi:exodeoxyribonuclease-3